MINTVVESELHAADAVVGFVMDSYEVNEDAGSAGVCVDSGVTEGFEADLTVSLSAIDGTACEWYNSCSTVIF